MTEIDKDEVFPFVVAKRWYPDEPMSPSNMSTYTYGSEIQKGTMEQAQNFLEYVQRPNNGGEGDWAIYRISFERVEPPAVVEEQKWYR